MARTHMRSKSSPQAKGPVRLNPFMIAVCAALLVSGALLAVMRMDKTAESLSIYRGPLLEVHGVQHDEVESYQETRDNEIMGTYPHEFRIGLNGGNEDPEGEVIYDTLTYRFSGENDAEHPYAAYFRSQVNIKLVGLKGNETEYRIDPATPEESGAWTANLKIPKDRNLENPVGTWRLMVSSSSGKWRHTTWLTVRGDGTGEYGSLDKDSESATASELAEATHPCTITHEKTPWGARLVASYEGGTYVMTVAERSMDDVLAPSV